MPFKGIISRDNGCPWPSVGMTTARWIAEVKPVEVRISDLIVTQPGVLFHALSENAPDPVGGDQIPHVISWRGSLYLEDGHHRVMRTLLSGRDTVMARVLEIPGLQNG